jgi:phage terminase large subunit-like protein
MKARKSPKQIMEELEAKKPKPPERIKSYQTGGAENSPSIKSPPKSAPLKRPIIKSIETTPLIESIPAAECNTDYDISMLDQLSIVNTHNQLNDPEAIPVTKEPIKRKRGRPPKNAPKLADVEPPKEDDFISGIVDPINEEQVLHKEINLKLPGINISNPVPRTGPSKLETFANFKWSQYIPKIPTTKQLAALMLEQEDELLYGGALGGGKSEWLAMECLRYCDIPNFAGIIFRRQLSDLKQPGSLIPRIASWLATFEAKGMCSYSGSDHRWTFKTTWPGTDIPGPPAFLQFGYIGEASVRERYQSAEFQRVCFEELGQWEDDVDYLFMFSRIRQVVCPIHGKDDKGEAIYDLSCPQCNALRVIYPGMRAASNPGPAWIKRRFGIRPDPIEFPNPRSALIAIQEGKKVKWVGTPGFPKFIAAYLWDNPHLNEKSYRKLLAQMTEGERSRLEDGNWEARKNARLKRKYQRFVQLHVTEDYLKDYSELEHIYQPAKWEDFSYSHVQLDSQGYQLIGDPIPFISFRKVYLTADPAVTAKRGPIDAENKQKNSYTGLGVFAETKDQELLWLSAMKFRKEIPDVIQSTTFLNEMWPIQYNKIEATGVGVTLAQFLESAGLNVTKNWKKTDKIENSMSSQMLLSKNRILFPINALWLEMVEDVIFNWTGLDAEEDDMVDVLSDASNDLSLKIASQLVDHKVHRSLPSTSGGFKGKFQIPTYGLRQ